MGMRGSGGMEGGVGGEIVEVPGGHIVRATGRKDRHSKVYTSKGPRDRRVRLSAHTAIQFYDVQDRLGYDRPSKAVDWLINKAKSAIEKLSAETVQPSEPSRELANYPQAIASSTHHEQEPESSEYGFQINRQIESFDAMRSCNSGLNFGGYKNDVIPRAANPDQQYLGLSLLPFQGNTTNPNFAGSSGTAASYDANYQRFSGWTGDLAAETRGFMVNSHTQTPMAWLGQQALMLPPPEPAPAPALLRGPLQSSFGQSFRAWGADQISTVDHLGDKSNSISLHPSSNFGIIQGFAVDGDPSSSSSSPPHSNQ